jgi:hypothetical protein
MQNMTPHERFVRPWDPLKGISINNVYVRDLSYPITTKKYINLKGPPKKNFRACGVIDSACTIFASENRSYLGEFEAKFQKALASKSGAQWVLFDKKPEGRKSRDTVPSRLYWLIRFSEYRVLTYIFIRRNPFS